MAAIEQQQASATIGGPVGGLGPGSPVLARPRPTPRPRIELCPYCGRESVNTTRCTACGGHFDALSKQATQNAMGPWWLREGERPIKPGCSYDTIRSMVGKGTVTRETVLRGPTTRQFWMRAGRVPGVAHLLGMCHSCQREVSPDAFMCAACGASFNTETDRQHLGLSPVSLLPGQAGAERIAAVSAASVPIAAPVAGPAPAGEVARMGSPLLSGYEGGAGGFGGGYARPVDGAWAARARLAGVRLSPAAMGAASGVGASGAGGGSAMASRGDVDQTFEVSELREESTPRRRGGSMAGAVGMMALGAIVAAGGVWVALVQANRGVEGALVAIGVRGRTAVADAGTGEADRQGPDARTPRVDDREIERAPEIVARVPDGASDNGEGVNDAPRASGESPAVVEAPGEGLMARLLEHVEGGQWREAGEVVADMERSGGLTTDDAAAWRMALDARLERAELAGLP